MHLISSLENLNSIIKNLGFVELSSHLGKTINDIKNVGTERCCIFPKMLNEFLSILEHECEKVKRNELDNNKLLVVKNSSNNLEMKKNSNKNLNPLNKAEKSNIILNNLMGNNISLKNLKLKIENPLNAKDREKSNLLNTLSTNQNQNINSKDRVISPNRQSPNVRDNSAQIEREILSKVKPVCFSGMLKLHFNASKSLVQKIDKCKELLGSNNNNNFDKPVNPFLTRNKKNDEIYPFKEENYNCCIF